jgi:hypothetical protein
MSNIDYAPILKWRPAELGALEELKDDSKDRILPVLELVLPSPKSVKNDQRTPQEKLESRYTRLSAEFENVPVQIMSAMGNRQVIFDIRLITRLTSQLAGLNSILSKSEELGLNVTPVIGITDPDELYAIVFENVKKYKHGLCIRIKGGDFADPERLDRRLVALLSNSGVGAESVDLLVDTEDLEDIEQYTDIFLRAQTLTNIDRWRSFIFANGAFPVDLTSFKPTDTNMVPRLDWLRWQGFATKRLKRLPIFSDYTVRHPAYNETTLNLSPSCSIKYTQDNDWQILKGYKYQYQYYVGYAVALVADESFPGATFSAGDRFFEEKAQRYEEIMKVFVEKGKAKGVGTNQQWIKACINHHLAQVLKQLADPRV